MILLMNAAGSILGPIAVAILMAHTRYALFIVAGTMLALLALWTGLRMRVHESRHEFFEPYAMVPRTTHEVTGIATPDPGAPQQAE